MTLDPQQIQDYLDAVRHWGDQRSQQIRYIETDVTPQQPPRSQSASPPDANRPDPFQAFKSLHHFLDLQVAEIPKTDPKSNPSDAPPTPAERQPPPQRYPVLTGLLQAIPDPVLLIGRPGSGKTTALERLLIQEAERLTAVLPASGTLPASAARPRSVTAPRLPLLVRLRDYRTSWLHTLQRSLKKHHLDLNRPAIQTLLDRGQFLLLLDGLNELPHPNARQDLEQLRRQYPRTPIIVTSRELNLGTPLGIEKKLEMLPLKEAQMQQFACAYLGDESGKQLLQKLGPRLREFGQTPLLLWMLCGVFHIAGQIPANLGLVFRSFVQIYDTQLKGFDDKTRSWQSRFLQRLAFAMMPQQGDPTRLRLTIPRQDAEDLFATTVSPLTQDIDALNGLDWLLNHHLLQLRGPNDIEFKHQLFQEYFAAEYLLRWWTQSNDGKPQLSDGALQKGYLNLLPWTEAMALLAGLLPKEQQAVRLLKLSLDVDLYLGARLAGAVNSKFQTTTINLLLQLSLPPKLKVDCLDQTGSEKAGPELCQLLVDRDWTVRRRTVEVLATLNYKDTIPGLRRALEDPNWDVCLRAATKLRKLGRTNGVIPTLLEALESGDPEVTWLATRELGELGEQGSEDAILGLLNALKHPTDPLVHIQSGRVLKKIKNEAAVPILLNALENRSWYVRAKAADSLGKLGHTAAIPHLLKKLQDGNFYVRMSAAKALGELGSETAISDLLNALKQQDPAVRRRSAEALGELGSKAAIPGLLKTLDDRNWHVREKTAEALGKLGSKDAVPALLKTLKDRKWRVREKTAEALGELGSEDAVPALLKALQDWRVGVRSEAVEALGKLGSKVAIPELRKALQDWREDVRCRAAIALGELGSEDAIPELRKALQDWRWTVRYHAAKALGKLGSAVAIPELLKALPDRIGNVRMVVAEALVELGNEAAIRGLLELLKHSKWWVRREAAYALGKLGTSETSAELWRVHQQQPEWYLAEAIQEIQNRCQIYNHEIAQLSLPEERSPVSPEAKYSFGAVGKVQIFEQVEGGYHEHEDER